MSVHVLERSQRVEVSVEQAFDFYVDARNLEPMTPPWLHFEVITPADVTMRPATLLDYKLKRTDEKVGPQVFLNLGREPVLPLSRLQE